MRFTSLTSGVGLVNRGYVCVCGGVGRPGILRRLTQRCRQAEAALAAGRVVPKVM